MPGNSAPHDQDDYENNEHGCRSHVLGAAGKLVMFVAVPLPVTGAWTGCVAAFIFKVPLKYAIPAVLLGIMIAGTIVTLASLGVIQIWGVG